MIKVYKDFDQRTEDWFKLKWAKVGGTDSIGLFVDSDTLMLKILGQVTEDFQLEENFANSAMIRGQELEPLALSELEKYTREKFINVAWIQSTVYDYLGISPDGITEDFTVGAEVKCFTAKEHLKLCLEDKIPQKNIYQALHYFTVNPYLKELHWASFRPESKIKPLFVKTLTRDSLVDIGRTKKGKIKEDRGYGEKEYVCTLPDLKTVEEWVKLAQFAALDLEDKIKESIDKLNF